MITLRKQHRRYEKYRDSGVEWLGEIPEEWETRRLKHLTDNETKSADQNITSKYLALENVESWTGKLIESEEEKILDAAKAFCKDDVLFGKLRPYLAKVHHAEFDGGCVGEFLVLRHREKINPHYLFYRLVAHDFINIVNNSTLGAKMPRAEWNFIGSLRIAFSDTKTQSSIATYLDEKCALIDSIITKKQRQLKLLKEKRAAIINRAVTRGLDESVEMKESEVEWIGEIPKHWKLKKIKHLASDIREISTMDESRYLALENIESWTGKLLEIELDKSLDTAKHFKENDVLFGKLRPYLAKVHLAKFSGGCVGELLIIRQISELDPNFLFYRLISEGFINVVNNATLGSKMPRAEWGFIGNLLIGYPDISEQIKIVSQINNQIEKIEKVLFKIENSISHLSEYKTSLIAHAVTGRIKVS